MSKRSRQEGWSEHRVTLNVGGKRFETTVELLERKTTFFQGMFESAAPEAEIFVDRDPEAFALLLRFMRQGIVAALLPRNDPALAASVLSEADYFGVDSLLQPVKAAAFRNQCLHKRFPHHHSPIYEPSAEPDPRDDDAKAAAEFDKRFGSVGQAIESGLLPARYFAPVERKVRALVPPSSTCWVQLGFISAESCLDDDDERDPTDTQEAFPYQPIGEGSLISDFNQFDVGQELPMSFWSPKVVRRVAYFATIEIDGVVQPEPEAMILLTDEDQHAWMRNSYRHDGVMPGSNDAGEIDPRTFVKSLSHGQRMLLLSDYIQSPALRQLYSAGRDYEQAAELTGGDEPSNIWTKVVIADTAPMQATFKLKPSHPGCKFPRYDTDGDEYRMV